MTVVVLPKIIHLLSIMKTKYKKILKLHMNNLRKTSFLLKKLSNIKKNKSLNLYRSNKRKRLMKFRRFMINNLMLLKKLKRSKK